MKRQVASSEDSVLLTTTGKPKHKNEAFYNKKRGLFRKAGSLHSEFECDVFIVVHHRKQDKIYSYTTDETNFSIDRVCHLVLHEMQSSGFLNKNKMYENVNFKNIQAQMEEMKTNKVLKQHD